MCMFAHAPTCMNYDFLFAFIFPLLFSTDVSILYIARKVNRYSKWKVQHILGPADLTTC